MRVRSEIMSGSLLLVLLLGGFAASAYGQAGVGTGPAAPGAPFGGTMKDMTLIRGNVVCANCSLDEARQARPDLGNLYVLQHDLGKVVLNINAVDDRARWESVVGLTHELQARAEEGEFRKLMAEENLFKEVEIAGVLRSTRAFDIANVAVVGVDSGGTRPLTSAE